MKTNIIVLSFTEKLLVESWIINKKKPLVSEFLFLENFTLNLTYTGTDFFSTK